MNKLLLWGGLAAAALIALGLTWDASSNIPTGFYERTAL